MEDGPLRIAVVGSGAAGLAATWLLGKSHHVTLFERATRLGGHANTVRVATPEGEADIDTGFIVYNAATYPNFIAFLAEIGITGVASSMSFAVSLGDGACEYSGDGVLGLIGQIRNVPSPAHWRMVRDIFRFFRMAPALAHDPDNTLTLRGWLADHRFSDVFVDRHLVPMAAAIWSAPADAVLDFPAVAFTRFFANHGLLRVRDRPTWLTIPGGSRRYVDAAARASRVDIRLATAVTAITRRDDGVTVAVRGGEAEKYDHVVIATQADEALGLLSDPAPEERDLAMFRYTDNLAVLHTDPRLMPRTRRLWSSWNVLSADPIPAITYWMNRLQPLPTRRQHFVTLNPHRPPREDATLAHVRYRHPVFDHKALAAQSRLRGLQGRRRTWFCGSYFGYGFHEDAARSGFEAAEVIGPQRRPWAGTRG